MAHSHHRGRGQLLSLCSLELIGTCLEPERERESGESQKQQQWKELQGKGCHRLHCAQKYHAWVGPAAAVTWRVGLVSFSRGRNGHELLSPGRSSVCVHVCACVRTCTRVCTPSSACLPWLPCRVTLDVAHVFSSPH